MIIHSIIAGSVAVSEVNVIEKVDGAYLNVGDMISLHVAADTPDAQLHNLDLIAARIASQVQRIRSARRDALMTPLDGVA